MRKSLPSLLLICTACASAPVRLPGEARGPDLPAGHREILFRVSPPSWNTVLHLVETPDTVIGELVFTASALVDAETREIYRATELEQSLRQAGCGEIIWRDNRFACHVTIPEPVDWREVFDRIDALDPWTLPDAGPLFQQRAKTAAAIAASQSSDPPPGGWNSGLHGSVRPLRAAPPSGPNVLDGVGLSVDTWADGQHNRAHWNLAYVDEFPRVRDRVMGMLRVVRELRNRVPRSDVRPESSP